MASMNQAEYLKRYMSEDTKSSEAVGTRKRKKKARKVNTIQPKSRSRIVDDDVDFESLLPENLGNTLEEDVGDNEPTVAEFIDERPDHIKYMEVYRQTDRWKRMTDNPSKHRRHDSDSDQSPIGPQRHDSDSDQSPVRTQRNDSDSDQSPVRTQRHDSDYDQSPVRTQRHDSDSDQSLPRKSGGTDRSSPRRKQRSNSGSDPSPPRRKSRHNSDSDQSPPRKGKSVSTVDQSPPRRQRRNSDSDQSPPRRGRPRSNSDQSSRRKKSKNNSDSDQSPMRKKRSATDRDRSPVRRKTGEGSDSIRQKNRDSGKGSQELTAGGKMKETLSGKKAGLSTAKAMRAEAFALQQKEDAEFKKIGEERLGKNAATVFRDKSGRRRNMAEEQEEEAAKNAEISKTKAKYKEWGQGLHQKNKQAEALADHVHEVSKPLARYQDDQDLDQMMRELDRIGDPMLAFIKKKKRDGVPVKERPRYKGPAPAPNRYGILPGYRWDGVDRSNGFEKKLFESIANRKAVEDMAYKWSVEDM